jgi:DNA polymerase-3 subunit delta
MAFTYDQIISDLKNKKYYPVYILSGEEPYFIDSISDYIEEHVLGPAEKDFNQTIAYGSDIDIQTLVSTAKRFPMMSEYQVVIVREAQEIKNIEDLAAYVEKPLKSTILVICYKYKKLDGRKALSKLVDKTGVLFECKKIYDNQLPAWISTYVQGLGYRIDPKASALIADHVGSDVSRIVQEIGKLVINVKGGTIITDDHVEQNIGISKEFNVFELQKALGEKNVYRSNLIAYNLSSNPRENPLVMIVPILFSYFSKLLIYHQLKDNSRDGVAKGLKVNPFFVQDYVRAGANYPMGKLVKVISLLREYDLKAKGVDSANVGEADLLKEMIYRILH